jgi:hypothetical protein
MTIPFTVEYFFLVFHDYNAAIWPAQIVAMVLGLLPLTALFVGPLCSSIYIALAVVSTSGPEPPQMSL